MKSKTVMPSLWLLTIALVVLNSGCMMSATPWNRQISAPYENAETVALMRPGLGEIIGRAIFVWKDINSITCAGHIVTLLPATPYAKQWFQLHLGGNGMVAKYSDLSTFRPTANGFLKAVRESRCDDSGEFRFTGLLPGNYIIHASANWRGSRETQDKTFYAMVNVQTSGTTKVILVSPYQMDHSNAPLPTVNFSKPIW